MRDVSTAFRSAHPRRWRAAAVVLVAAVSVSIAGASIAGSGIAVAATEPAPAAEGGYGHGYDQSQFQCDLDAFASVGITGLLSEVNLGGRKFVGHSGVADVTTGRPVPDDGYFPPNWAG